MKALISTSVTALVLMIATVACDDGDGPVDKAWDCAQLCDEAADCVGGDDFDEAECRDSCVDDADDDAVDACEDCLDNTDSCASNASCTAECAGVLASTVFN